MIDWKSVVSGILGALALTFIVWLFGLFSIYIVQVPVPRKAVVAFNSSACPAGWDEVQTARGRYIVGLSEHGILGATKGKQLADQEDRPAGKHTHPYLDKYFVGPNGPFVGWTGGSYGWGESLRVTQPNTDADDKTAAVDGTNAPYIQYLYCEKS